MNKITEDLINAAIAGGLVFAGAFVGSGTIDTRGVIAAFAASVIVFLNKLREGLADNKTTKLKKIKMLSFI